MPAWAMIANIAGGLLQRGQGNKEEEERRRRELERRRREIERQNIMRMRPKVPFR